MKAHYTRAVAIVICLVAYWFTRLPAISDLEVTQLAKRFSFTRLPLPETSSLHRTQRAIDDRLSHISGWISSVGASIALGDIDGDGLPNDACIVDPRTDEVIVAPVPNTGGRYLPFTLTFVEHEIVLHSSPSKLHDQATPMGCRIADLDEDGFQDLLVYFWGRTPLAFLALNHDDKAGFDGSFFQRHEIVPGGGEWYTNALTVADVDGDGHFDLVVGNYDRDGTSKMHMAGDLTSVMQDSMSRAFNGGTDRFLLWKPTDIETSSRITFQEAQTDLPSDVLNGWTLAVGAADLDGDLLPEIYLANDFGPDRLLHNRSLPGKLRFAVVNGVKGFTTPNSKVLGRDSFKGMGIDFADINHDGVSDFFVSNIAGSWSLEESHFAFVSTGKCELLGTDPPSAPYTDESETIGLSRSGWGWDARFADFNNDGVIELIQGTGFLKGGTCREDAVDRWPELHELAIGNDALLANPSNWPRFRATDGDDLSGYQHNPFFVRAADGRFYDIAPQLGEEFTEPYVTRGVATADCDGDGDIDFAIANQWEQSWFFQNNCAATFGEQFLDGARPTTRPSIVLDLLLPIATLPISKTTVYDKPQRSGLGSPAIGAVARVGTSKAIKPFSAANGSIFTAQVDGGNGHSGQRSPQLHFGLGDTSAFPSPNDIIVEVEWRDRRGKRCKSTLSIGPGNYTILLADEEKATSIGEIASGRLVTE